MKKVICFLVILIMNTANALVPLEGIVFGDVQESKQYDPFAGLLSFDYSIESGEKDENSNKIKYYYGLYQQGTNLKLHCNKDPRVNYSYRWQKDIATRSIASTLQYIGIDQTVRAIPSYAKKLEFTDSQFETLVDNLVRGTCSKNLSVYGKKLIKDNFMQFWRGKKLYLPQIKNNPFYQKSFKERHNTLEVTRREFNYTLRNFRAFCSWNGDTTDYRMLVPYLKNPYIMSIIFNNMNKKKLSLDKKTKELFLIDDQNGIQVACEGLICRNRTQAEFKKFYPRMLGSTKLVDDFNSLYCDHFSNVRYMKNKTNTKIKEWITVQSFEESKLEIFNFLGLLTKIPDPLIVAKNYNQIQKFLKTNIKERWNKWAESKVTKFHNDHLYEEPLEVKLISNAKKDEIKNGEFRLLFDVGLSEIDKVLEDIDKIDSVFYIQLSAKYIAYLREKVTYHYNRSEFEKVKHIESNLIKRVNHQLNFKKSFFKIPIWNEQIGKIMAKELIEQFLAYRGTTINKLSKNQIKIPVRFRFGLFALHYIRQKNIYQKNEAKILTFN